MDILAEKGGLVYKIQVKSTAVDKNVINYNTDEIIETAENSVNLVVVFFTKKTKSLSLVIPFSFLYMLTSGGFKDKRAPMNLKNVNFIRKDSEIFIRNTKCNVTFLIDRYDLLNCTDDDPYAIPEYAEWAGDGSIIFGDDQNTD